MINRVLQMCPTLSALDVAESRLELIAAPRPFYQRWVARVLMLHGVLGREADKSGPDCGLLCRMAS